MTWTPPPEVLAAGRAAQGHVPHAQGRIIRPGEPAQLAVLPYTRTLATFVREHFPEVSSTGTARSSSRWHHEGQRRDVHEEGRAIDAMTRNGERLANWLVSNAVRLGVQLVIWDRLEWSSSNIGAAWEPYTGESAHTDHVHIEVGPHVAGLAQVPPVTATPPGPPDGPPSWAWWAAALATVAGGSKLAGWW